MYAQGVELYAPAHGPEYVGESGYDERHAYPPEIAPRELVLYRFKVDFRIKIIT